MTKMGRMSAIKVLFERKDAITPDGGRKVDAKELIELKKADSQGFDWMARECAKVLNVELETELATTG